ncbi:MAG: hypothetical protein R2739_10195 [Chitinophagales bacterium]
MKNIKFISTINAVYITALMVISYRLTNTINNHWDIIAADELSYLKFGKNIIENPRFDWGFLYNLWYKFLSFFQYNTVDLYYFNYKVLITIIPVLLFICLLVYKVNTFIAFVISYLYLISKLHVTTWPFVSDFCIVLILSFFIIIHFIKEIAWKSVLLTFFSFLLYLVRPEYMAAFILSFFFSIYYNRKNKAGWILLFVMLTLLIYVGDKTSKVSGLDRGFFAYAQHYVITYKIWNKGTSLDFYQYIDLAPKIFGKSFTLIGSIIYNPLEAIRHVVTCIGFYVLTFLKSMEDFLVPSVWTQVLGKFRHLLLLVILLIGFLIFRKSKTNNVINGNKFFLFSIFVFFLGGVISNFIIGYNPHYFQLHFILYILMFCKVLLSNTTFKVNNFLSLLVFLLTVIFVPKISNYPLQQVDFKESKNLPVQKLALILNEMNDNKKHCLLAFQTNLNYIVEGNNFSGIDVFSIDKPFLQFIKNKNVDFIYINEQIKKDERLVKDKEWKIFIANPEYYNFRRQEIKNSKNYLLIKD